MNGAPASGRMPTFGRARVSDAMAPGVITCPPNASLRTVARIMSANHVHMVVLAGPGERPVRAVAERELLEAAGSDLDRLSASELAVRDLPVASPNASLAQATRLMSERGVSHLLVVDGTGAPAGVLSALDVAGVLAGVRA